MIPLDRQGAKRVWPFLVLSALPWTVLVDPGGVHLVFLWGLATPGTWHVVDLWAYLFVFTSGLPDRLLAWPASTVVFFASAVAAVAEAIDRGDARVTGGLLGLSAIAHLGFVLGVADRGGSTVVPLGPALVVVVLWWSYWPIVWERRDDSGDLGGPSG